MVLESAKAMASTFDFGTTSLAQHFLDRVAAASSSFNKTEFLLTFDLLEYQNKVDVVYKNLHLYNFFPHFVKDLKDDGASIEHRLHGNFHLREGNYLRALENYGNSIATAKSKVMLALTNGSRAECFYKLGKRKQCFGAIEKALEYYPGENLQELVNRREAAQKLPLSNESYYEKTPEIPNSQINLKIPCASDCIKIEDIDGVEYVVATRDIEIGEVISVEKPYSCAIFANDRLNYCHYCLELCYDMIPCEHCTQALFCSELCKKRAKTTYHNYECPILLTLSSLAINNNMLMIALRTTFLAISDCFLLGSCDDDDRHCFSERHHQMEFLKPKMQPPTLDLLHQAVLAACVYELVRTKTSFFQVDCKNWPKKDIRNKFKEVLLLQLMASKVNAVKIYDYIDKFKVCETDNFAFGVYPFFSIFPHSCCANVMKSYHGNTMVLRALNTIKQDEMCFVNRYGLRYDAYPKSTRDRLLVTSGLPKCKCTACEMNWKPWMGDLPQICDSLGIENVEFDDIVKKFIGTDLGTATELLPCLVALLKHCEQKEPFGNALTLKKLIAHCYVIFGNKRRL